MLAFIFTLLCILVIGFMWHFTMNNSSLDGRNGDFVVLDRTDVETMLQHANISPTTPRIPTRFFIKSMEFLNADDVLITGHIWQNISSLGLGRKFLTLIFRIQKKLQLKKSM